MLIDSQKLLALARTVRALYLTAMVAICSPIVCASAQTDKPANWPWRGIVLDSFSRQLQFVGCGLLGGGGSGERQLRQGSARDRLHPCIIGASGGLRGCSWLLPKPVRFQTPAQRHARAVQHDPQVVFRNAE